MTHSDPATKPTLADRIAEYRKAIAAFVAAPGALLVVALTEGSEGGTAVTAHEWAQIGLALVVGTVAVAAIPNRQPS